MQADALTARNDRLGRVRVALVSAAAIAAVALAPATALAKGSAGSTTSWIALASVNGSSAAAVQPKLGSAVKFNAGYPTTTKNPWVSLTCYEGSTLVYAEGNSPSATFTLGGASSTWLTVGGAANCTAELGDLYWKGGREYYTYLATTSFGAGG